MQIQIRFLLSALLAMIMMMPTVQAEAASKQELNATVKEALDKLYK